MTVSELHVCKGLDADACLSGVDVARLSYFFGKMPSDTSEVQVGKH